MKSIDNRLLAVIEKKGRYVKDSNTYRMYSL